eukprot:90784-Chlamydomonas_euryale.AAC.2
MLVDIYISKGGHRPWGQPCTCSIAATRPPPPATQKSSPMQSACLLAAAAFVLCSLVNWSSTFACITCDEQHPAHPYLA